jgi:antitoxin (DNA-binding transcriptional repressor) of toxin-antitoxin stability system
MDTVSVAELKSRLSHYLREVRAGKSFTVLSRDIPVATLGPWEPGGIDDLEVIEPDPDATPLFEPMLTPLRHPLPDAVELLRRDRDDRDARLADIVREALEARRAADVRAGEDGEQHGDDGRSNVDVEEPE